MGSANTNKKSSIHLKVNLTTEDAKAAIKSLATQFENMQKASAIDFDVKNLKGIGSLLTQLKSLDETLTSLIGNSQLAASGLSENVAGAVNGIIDNFQRGNSLADGFLQELNEISNATDKSAIPEKIRNLVDKINGAFKEVGIGTKINADDILKLDGTKEQLTSLANYVTQFTSGWSAGMTFAAKQTDGLVKATGNIDAKINALIEKLNKLKIVENSIGSIFKKLSSGAEFSTLNAKEKDEIDDFAVDVLNKYNKAKEIFASSQSSLEMRRKAAIDMAKAAKDSIRVLSYEDNGFEIYDMVDQKTIDGLSKIKKDILSRSEEIKSILRTEITSIEKQLTDAGIDIKTQVNVTPKADPNAGKKIKQVVEESAPKSVEVPVQANIDTEHAKEVLSIAEQLQNVFDIGRKKNTLEYKILFTTDGLDIRNGSFEGVNSKTYAEALLGNLVKGINVNAHSHMGKYSEFTLPDIQSAVDAKKNLGINLSAVIGPNDIATLDLAQVKLEDLYTLLEKLSKLPYSDAIGIRAKDLNNALKEINPNYGDIFQQWKPEKFIELAKYINDVSQATQSTINPLEQFKNIISFIASKDIDFSKYQNALNSLSENNFSPEALRNAFNEIAKAENLMSDGKLLQIDLPEKSTLDAVTKSLHEQIEAYRTKRKEAGLTFDKLRQEVLMLEGNKYDIKGSFIERFFHPSELDDVVKIFKSGDSVKKITERLASEFNIEIPVKPKVDTKPVEDNYQKVLDILNQIAAKQKEIKDYSDADPSVDITDRFIKDYGTLDEFKSKIKEVFEEYYKLQQKLNSVPKSEKAFYEPDFRRLEEYKAQIAGLYLSAKEYGFNIDDLFDGKQLRTINSNKAGIQDLINKWKEYSNVISEVDDYNRPIENSISSLRDSVLEFAKTAGVSKDAWNTIVGMLYNIDESTDFNKFATTISGLISGKITPEITILKQQLANMFQDTDIDKLESKYGLLFSDVESGSLTAAQALEKIEKQEKEIAEAARQREEAQRKANEAPKEIPKPVGAGTGSSGTGTGSGGTSTPSGTGTGSSVNMEIADLERLKQKVSEVEIEVIKKTRAFNDERTAVTKAVEAEISELTKLSTKIKQVIGEVNNYSTAWTNADSNVVVVLENAANKLVELETKLTGTINNINGIGQGSGVDSGSSTLSLYDQILEKVKQAKVESEKIKHSPDLNKLFEGALLWSSRQRDTDQAIVSIDTLIDKIKYLNQLDKSVSMQEYVSSGLEKYKDIQTQLFDIDAYTKGSDAPGARTWDKLISNIKEKFLGLAHFLQNENIDIFSSLNPEQLQIIENFNFKSLLGELDSYSSMIHEVQTTNINARDSLSAIVKEIIEIANAAGMAQDKVQGLKDYLYGFKHMFPVIGDADETTNKILDSAGLLHTNTKEKHNEETAYSNITDSQLSSTLETLNTTLSKMIGSGDPANQSQDQNGGLSGIATNVSNIYDILLKNKGDDESKQSKNDSDDDTKLTSTLNTLNETLSRMIGSNDPATQNTDPSKGLSGIADNVANIYGVLNGRKDGEDEKLTNSIKSLVDELRKPTDSDNELAGAIKSAVEELKNASKDISDDAKLRKESNTKYKAASDRISTDAGRDTILGSINRKYGDEYFIPDGTNTKFSALSGGIVKVETVLQDLNNKFYDCAVTIDSQGNVITSSMKENSEAARKYAEQEKALAQAREEAYKKSHKTIGQITEEKKQKELESKRTISPEVLDSTVKSTTKAFNDYSSNNIGNMPKYLAEDYSALLDIIKKVKSENRNLDEEELRAIESMCLGLQNEIALLEVVNSNYDEKVQTLKESAEVDGISLLGKEDTQQFKKLIDEINDKIKQLHEKLNVSDVSLINKEDIKADQKEIDELTNKAEKFIETAKKAKAQGGLDTKKANKFNKETGTYNQLIGESKDLSLGENGIASLNRYQQAYNALLEKKQYFQSISKNDVTEEDIQEWDRLTKELSECRKEYEAFAKEYAKGKVVSISAEDAQDVNKLRESMLKLASDGEKGKIVSKQYNDTNKKLTMSFRDANNELKEVIVTYNSVTGTLTKSIGTVKTVKNSWEEFADKVGNKVKEMGAYFATFGGFYEVVAVVRQGITYVREIDSALTELKKVTDATDAQYDQFLQTMSKTAGVIGSTVKDLTTMSAEWARLGYSMEESAKLAESTAILLNVSEFKDATEASEALISTMQAFQYTADESTHVVDILNEVGKFIARR